ncbi:hypothetical protein [Streptomyces sp. NPDC055749]
MPPHAPLLPRLSDAHNKVASTDETDTKTGDFDAEGNSFSTQKLAAVGLIPEAPVSALGAQLTWPTAAPGTKNIVSSAGQAVKIDGWPQPSHWLWKCGHRLPVLRALHCAGPDQAGQSRRTSGNGSIHFFDIALAP